MLGFGVGSSWSAGRRGLHRRIVAVCSVEGVSFQSGKRLLLEEEKSVKNVHGEQRTGYVRCEICATCYLLSFPVPAQKLKCSVCGNQWDGETCTPYRLLEEIAEDQQEAMSTNDSNQLNCVHFDKCSGCTIDNNFKSSNSINAAVAFGRSVLKVKRVEIVTGDITGWRTTAKLAVRRKGRHIATGLYQRGSHDLISIPQCAVHHPQINIVAAAIAEEATKTRTLAYEEKKGVGMLRYVHMMVEQSTGKVSVTLVWNMSVAKDASRESARLVKALWARNRELKLHSLWLNLNTSRGNTILASEPQRWKLMRGEQMLRENILDASVYFSPAAFRQANLQAFETLLRSLVKFVPRGSRVVEFCAGVGAIGLAVLSQVKLSALLCTELNAASEEPFRVSASKLPPEFKNIVSFETGTAAALRERLLDADVVIADPPRSGLDFQFLELLCAPKYSKPTRFIYVSCGLDSFKKDATRLLSGGWQAIHSEAHLFFPGTDHVETLTIFDRSVTK